MLVATTLLLALLGSSRAQCDLCHYEDSRVYCSNLGLTSVPSCVPQTATLLDLSYNNLTELTGETFQALPLLQTLYLDHNQLVRVAGDAFGGLPDLHFVTLWANDIASLPDDLFSSNPKMTHLDLSQNRIASLDTRLLRPLENLQTLVVYYNGLSRLVDDIGFSFGPSLQYFHAASNLLTTIDPAIFLGARDLYVYLEYNPWHCDCATSTLRDIFASHNFTLNRELYCSSPPELEGLTWDQAGHLCTKSASESGHQ